MSIEAAIRLAFAQLRERFGERVPTEALDVVVPLILEVLRPEVRRADEQARAFIQSSIDDALRRARLI